MEKLGGMRREQERKRGVSEGWNGDAKDGLGDEWMRWGEGDVRNS